MFGLGVGAVVMPPLTQCLIAAFGWHIAFSTVGAAVLVLALPIIGAFLQDSPHARSSDSLSDLVTDGTTRPHTGFTWREACRNRTFWLMFASFVFVAAAVQGVFSHLAAITADRGSPAKTTALLTSVCGAALLIGRTGAGYLLDRFSAPRVAALVFCSAGVGIGLLCATKSQGLVSAAAFLVGFGLGAEGDIMAYLTSRYFGLRSFGQIYGITFAGFALAGGLGTFMMGAGFDANGSYTIVFCFLSILAFIGAALIITLGPYRYGA